MNDLWRKFLGVSLVVFTTTLMAFSNSLPWRLTDSSDSVKNETQTIEDIYFEEDCTSCRYITIYDENDQLVYDKLIMDVENIEDSELLLILDKSYFLMKNTITDYYILSK